METSGKIITVKNLVKAPVEKVWKMWTFPEHITRWNYASEEWHSPTAENDLRPGGRFVSRMEAKDGSMGFDFEGIYDEVKPNQLIKYSLGDGRKVEVIFENKGEETQVTESFEAENTHSLEIQQEGWQAILNNFKGYVESN